MPTRDDDVLGVGTSWVEFSNRPGAGFATNSETATEAFYKCALVPWLALTVDLQHVRNPGGVAGRPDALVGTTRFVARF